MKVDSPTGAISVESSEELVDLLSKAGNGDRATFYLSHLSPFPLLSVHLNDLHAYVHYFPSDQHPGFQSHHMTPEDCPEEVSFHYAPGEAGDLITMPKSCVVHRDDAIKAASEFFGSLERPASLDWIEL